MGRRRRLTRLDGRELRDDWRTHRKNDEPNRQWKSRIDIQNRFWLALLGQQKTLWPTCPPPNSPLIILKSLINLIWLLLANFRNELFSRYKWIRNSINPSSSNSPQNPSTSTDQRVSSKEQWESVKNCSSPQYPKANNQKMYSRSPPTPRTPASDPTK